MVDTQDNRVLVVGATGQLGGVIARKLIAARVPVRALARRRDKLEALAAPGVEIAAIDLLDLAKLTEACRGISQIIATANNNMGKGAASPMRIDLAGYQNLCAAARNTGVRRLLYVSFRGASPHLPVDIFRLKWHIEDVIRRSGVPYVILRPTAFMDVWIDQVIADGIRKKGVATLFGDGTAVANSCVASCIPFAEVFENDSGIAAHISATKILDSEPAPRVVLVDPGHRMIVSSHLGLMAAQRGELARHPAAHVDGQCRRLRAVAERVGRDPPQTGIGRRPSLGVRGLHDFAHDSFEHRDAVQGWSFDPERSHRRPRPLVHADVIQVPVQSVRIEGDDGIGPIVLDGGDDIRVQLRHVVPSQGAVGMIHHQHLTHAKDRRCVLQFARPDRAEIAVGHEPRIGIRTRLAAGRAQ
jgi:hypothetical protein